MSLFPKCKFEVRIPDGVVRSGEKLEGTLTLHVPEPIPRAEHVDLFFRTVATAGYGGGKNRTEVARDMFVLPMHIDLPKDTPLAAGKHSWPFSLDIPAWLPPSYRGLDCSIRTTIDVRLDVDWAIDPKTSLAPTVVMPPVTMHAAPLTTRSPDAFHASLVVEVTLDSSVVALDQPIRGHIALRGGHDARFDALVISVNSLATISMSQRDRRDGGGLSLRIPKDGLVTGESVPFEFPPNGHLRPTFQNGFIDHQIMMRIAADIPWATDPSFEFPIQLVPAGSTIEQEGVRAATVGAMRLRQLATIMAAESGLPVGRLPTLVEGPVGSCTVRLADSPRSGRLGLDLDFAYPDLAVGIQFRPVGLLDAFRESPLLPAAISTAYLLRIDPPAGAPPVPDSLLKALVETCLADAARALEIRFSDHHLGFHFQIADDGSDQMIQFARFATARAKAIMDAVAALPFPADLPADAWRAMAAEQSAFLVPHVPAIHGVVFNARVLGGEARSMAATIRTVWREGKPVAIVDVDLREAALPQSISAEIEHETGLAAVRAVLPVIHATTAEKVQLEAAGWVADPRVLLAPLEQFFDVVLDARGERRTDSPYR